MTRITTLSTVLLAAAVGPGCGAREPRALEPTADRVRVAILTWNVGRIHGGWDSRARDDDLERVARVIQRVGADFVALQELRDGAQLARLLGRLGGRYAGDVADDAYDRHAALLVKSPLRPRFTQVTTTTGRDTQAARVTLPGPVTATVVSVHLDAFDPRRRLRQARDVVAWSERQASDEVFLAGDFNFDAERAAEARPEPPDLDAYRHLVRSHQDLGRYAGGTTILGLRLDYLFARSARIRKGRVSVLPGRRARWMDHDPVLGEFLLDRRRVVM